MYRILFGFIIGWSIADNDWLFAALFMALLIADEYVGSRIGAGSGEKGE